MRFRKIILLVITLIMIMMTSPVPFGKTSGQVSQDEYVFRRSWGGEGISNPYDVAISPSGTIYVTDRDYVVIIHPGERIFNRFGGTGSDPGQFNGAAGIALDSLGNVYVADVRNQRIQKFSSNGVFITQWGGGVDYCDGIGQFCYPTNLAFDSKGNVYVVNTESRTILKLTSDGELLKEFGSWGTGIGEFDSPSGVAVDSIGNVYVADYANHRIQKFTSNGLYITQWGTEGSDIGQFKYPHDISIDKNDNVFVADQGNHRIQEFTANGVYVTQWGSYGSNPGQFRDRIGIGINSTGDVFVADSFNHRIQMFTSSGGYITQWGEVGSDVGHTWDIVLDSTGNVFVTDLVNDRIQKFNLDGVFITQWGETGSDPGQFSHPKGIDVDNTGNVYVVDSQNQRIQKFTSNGVYILQWGGGGIEPGSIRSPSDIAVDGTGIVYVGGDEKIQKYSSNGVYLSEWSVEYPFGIALDNIGNVYVSTGNDRIQKFNLNGVFIMEWGETGTSPGQFTSPRGIDVDLTGNVYVVDFYNDRIQKFSSNGVFITQWSASASGISVAENGKIYTSGDDRIQIFTPGLPDPDPYSGLVLNGTFESIPSLTEWTYGGDLPVSRSTHAAQGSFALQLGVPVVQTEQGLGDAWAHSTFYVRPEWSRPTLSFKYNMFVNDIMDYSDFFVAIQDGVGLNHLATVVRDGFQPCIPGVAPSPGRDLGWRSVTYDLSAYKGQHIRLVFSNRNLWPGSWGIWTYVDDVRVIDAGPLPPMLGPYFSYLPLINNYRCDPVLLNAVSNIENVELRNVP